MSLDLHQKNEDLIEPTVRLCKRSEEILTSDVERIIIDPKKIEKHPIMEYTPKDYLDAEMYKHLKMFFDRGATQRFEVFLGKGTAGAYFEGPDVLTSDGPCGSLHHWYMYLADELMFLVDEKNFSVDEAWKVVCIDSKVLFQNPELLKWKSYLYYNMVVKINLGRRIGHYWLDVGAKINFPLAFSTDVNYWKPSYKKVFCVRNCDD